MIIAHFGTIKFYIEIFLCPIFVHFNCSDFHLLSILNLFFKCRSRYFF